MKKCDQKHKAIKDDFDTMVGVNNNLKKHIDLMVDKKYLKGVRKQPYGAPTAPP